MDSETIRRAQGGDLQAFEAIVAELQQPISSVCYRILGDLQDAEEVTQDVMLRLHRSLPRIDSDREIFFFARRIAVNESIDRLNERRRRPHATAGDEALEPLASLDAGPERDSSSAEIRRRILASLADLTPRERAVFVLRALEDESFATIGKTLSIREVTARRLYGLARLRLMKLLGDLV